MKINHEMGGDMTITLSSADIAFMNAQGFCMDRNGLVGTETKTWVRIDQPVESPEALIDGASDVYVHLTAAGVESLPVRIEGADIDPYIDEDRARVEFYFGTMGGIIVTAANA